MINHETKCIFIHIPRCAGTYIELLIDKRDWWNVDIAQKHLSAKTSRNLYREYWDEYFKFSFIRNPWSLEVSWYFWKKSFLKDIKFKEFIIDEDLNKTIKLSSGLNDRKFVNIFPNFINCYDYLQIENEIPLDFIGRYENLNDHLNLVSKKLNINLPMQNRLTPRQINRTEHSNYKDYYDDETRQIVAKRYEKDINYFEFKFDE